MIGLIVARSKNNVIGKDGMIPWSIEGEQSQFKELTTNNTIIMGRKTYEDIGHPLPNRKNIVISRTTNYDDVVTVDSLEKAIELSEGNIYIIGWYNLFKEAIPMVDIMFITEVNLNIENGDVFFPDFDEDEFDIKTLEENSKYKRLIYTRKDKNITKRWKMLVYKNTFDNIKTIGFNFPVEDKSNSNYEKFGKEKTLVMFRK